MKQAKKQTTLYLCSQAHVRTHALSSPGLSSYKEDGQSLHPTPLSQNMATHVHQLYCWTSASVDVFVMLVQSVRHVPKSIRALNEW